MLRERLRRIDPQLIGALAILVLALAGTMNASADKTTKRISFDHEVIIGGTTLRAGEYILIVEGEHLTVKSENKIVAQTAAHWEARGTKPDRDSVLYGDNNQVIEIRFARLPDVLIITGP
jgi:hypothetical protein